MSFTSVSRRAFLTYSAILPWALKAHAAGSIPVGLELYSVRDELQKDPQGTVRAVAKMGYQGVEFYAPYFEWTESQTKDMKKAPGRSGNPMLFNPQRQRVLQQRKTP